MGRERMYNMETMSIGLIGNGIVAGAAVAAISAAAVVGLGSLIGEGEGTLRSAGTWAAASVAFGIVAVLAYTVLRSSFSIDASGYLCLALGFAAVLTALEFAPIYGASNFAPHWQTYAALNFIFALGFGLMVPRLVG
ncbi:MAG: hypothetical protein ISF22_10080 [Methanomassiliicoccus sp.]|nr:hypothetical protein [Methanomassiliicoccus sp.]